MDLEKQALATLLALAIVGAPAVASDWKVSLVAGEQRLAAHDLPGAEEYFRQALAAVKRQKHSRAELAQCMERLADVLQQLSETDEVIPLYKKALAIETAAKSPRVLPVLLSLGKVYSAEGNYKQAGKTFERAVNAAGSNAIAAAECRRLLGNAEQQLGNLAKAEQCYKDALSALMSEQALPSIDSLHATLSDYLDLFLKSDEHQRNIASSFQKELLKDDLGDIARTQSAQQSFFSKEVSGRLAKDGPAQAAPAPGEKLPPIVPDRAMADFVALEKINQQRVAFYERMIASDIDSLGANHPSVARDLGGLAAIYISQRKYNDARPLLDRALSIYRTTYGGESLLAKRTASLIEILSEGAGRPVLEPSSDYLKSLPRVPAETGKLEIALQFNQLALLAYSRGQIEDAAKYYGWALADTVLATGNSSPLVAACLTDYGKVLRTRGQTADADIAEKDAHSILTALRAKRTLPTIP